MSLNLESLSAALGDRYAVERELARGGMATVYVARDVRHRRPVAVKVMHPRVATALDSERFLREIEVAGSLTHPLIVPLYDSGRANGLLYYIMPYIEGAPLSERIGHERQLPIEDALQIARDVAGALGYAHTRGVLHRDVKPDNILLAGGHAMLTDFGLARAIGAAEYMRLTETGVIVGTAFYMSPEQIQEDPGLDQRTDIYSLGCILFEMLTGEPPYSGTTPNQLIKRIMTAPVPSAKQRRGDVPGELDQAVARALAKSPEERFATMEEFTAALRARQAPEQAKADEPAGRTGPLSRVVHAFRSIVSRTDE